MYTHSVCVMYTHSVCVMYLVGHGG